MDLVHYLWHKIVSLYVVSSVMIALIYIFDVFIYDNKNDPMWLR